MAQIKLELNDKTPEQLVDFADHVADKLTGNANFPDADPTPVQIGTKSTALRAKLTQRAAMVTALEVLDSEIVTDADELKVTLTASGADVTSVAKGDETKLLSSGFPLRDANTPIGQLPAPGDVRATAGAFPGTIQFRWDVVHGTAIYEGQFRLHESADPWTASPPSTQAKLLLEGLVPGANYAFRVRARGAAGPSPWSDECVHRAP